MGTSLGEASQPLERDEIGEGPALDAQTLAELGSKGYVSPAEIDRRDIPPRTSAYEELYFGICNALSMYLKGAIDEPSSIDSRLVEQTN